MASGGSNPYSSPRESDSGSFDPTRNMEMALHELITQTKDLVWQVTSLKGQIDAEHRRAAEFRAMIQHEMAESRKSIEKLTNVVEYLKSGLSVSTSQHGPVLTNRKW